MPPRAATTERRPVPASHRNQRKVPSTCSYAASAGVPDGAHWSASVRGEDPVGAAVGSDSTGAASVPRVADVALSSSEPAALDVDSDDDDPLQPAKGASNRGGTARGHRTAFSLAPNRDRGRRGRDVASRPWPTT